jgi:hypothetical protein
MGGKAIIISFTSAHNLLSFFSPIRFFLFGVAIGAKEKRLDSETRRARDRQYFRTTPQNKKKISAGFGWRVYSYRGIRTSL